jgi:hypothetical protein
MKRNEAWFATIDRDNNKISLKTTLIMPTLTLIDLSRQLDCVVRQNKILFEIVDIFVDNFSTFKDRVRGLTSTQQSKIAHLKRCFGDLQVK